MKHHLGGEKYDHAYVVTVIHDNISVDWLRVLTDCSVDQIVHSWDNLTSKGMFIVVPEKLLVWGRYDKNVAIHQHNISEDVIEIIGPIIISTYAKNQSRKRVSCEYVLFAGVTPAVVSNEWAYVECLSKILFHFDKKMKLIYRPHPRVLRLKKLDFIGAECNIENDYKVIKYSENIFIDAHHQSHISSMKFLQSKCSCVVTYYSTVSLEFILSGKPAINFNYEILSHTKINKSVPKYEHIMELKKELLFVEVSDNTALKNAIKKYSLYNSKEQKSLSSSLNIAPIE